MAKIILMAESGSDIHPEYAAKYNIKVIPMQVGFGDIYKDDGFFPITEILDYYDQTGKVPKTAATNPAVFDEFFTQLHEEYPDHSILYMAYSGQTTSTFANGCLAAQDHPYVIPLDTKQVSVGQCAAVTLTAEAIAAHPEWTVEQCVQEAERICESVHMCFLPANLDFLRAGGRCSGIVAFCGNLLKLHPQVDIIDGLLKVGQKYRGSFKRLIPKVLEEYMKQYDLSKERIWLVWSEGLSEELKDLLRTSAEKAGIKNIEFVKTGGVITCHGGPGAFGIVGYKA